MEKVTVHSTTAVERLRIGLLKKKAGALVDKMVDELLASPELLDGVDYVSLELRYLPSYEYGAYGWDSERLDTPE
jgi:hypothetical protein